MTCLSIWFFHWIYRTLLTLVWKRLMCGLFLVSLWYLNCLHCWKEVFEFHYQISMGYWLAQVISILKCYLYQYLKESIRKHSSKINSTWTKRQTFHSMSIQWRSHACPSSKTEDEIRQSTTVWNAKSCFGQVVSTKKVTDRNVQMECGQEQLGISESLMEDLQKSDLEQSREVRTAGC